MTTENNAYNYKWLNLYYCLIYLYLAYCNMIWSSNYVTGLSHMVTLWEKTIRSNTKFPYNSHTTYIVFLTSIK